MEETFEIEESCIYGRNYDKETLIQKLMFTDEANDNGTATFQVISVMGIGGIGKTFLTKHVYGDTRVQACFDVRVWICAATKFDLLKLAKDILEAVTLRTFDPNVATHNHVLLELRETLDGKKFLIVLDDVWNDDRVEWNFLLANLESGTRGSRVIVTTRSQSVASALGASSSLVLSELSDDHCWNLFAKHAFGGGRNSSRSHDSGLERIGKEIARKCHGLPLIAVILGDLLGSTKDVKEWEKILYNMEVGWDCNVFMILKLSHVDLLFHLKQCLAFRIKSPKDYDFVKRRLVLSWIEEGFVRNEENRRKEEVDYRYFHVTNLVLEILLVTCEQIATPKKPQYALFSLVLSLAAMAVCITELAHKGQIKQKMSLRRERMIKCWVRRPASNDSPYTFLDVFCLVSGISQIIFASIAYSYMRRGAQNPIKVCVVPVIFIICIVSSKLFSRPNETNVLHSTRDS